MLQNIQFSVTDFLLNYFPSNCLNKTYKIYKRILINLKICLGTIFDKLINDVTKTQLKYNL